MSTLLIKRPFKLSMEFVNVEEYIPSLQIKISVTILHSSGEFNYCANDIWFAYSDWKSFLSSINNTIEPSGNLRDMSELFALSIKKNGQDFIYSLICKEPLMGKKSTFASIICEESIDVESFESIRDAFLDFILPDL